MPRRPHPILAPPFPDTLPPALQLSCGGCGFSLVGRDLDCRECALRAARMAHLVGWLASLTPADAAQFTTRDLCLAAMHVLRPKELGLDVVPDAAGEGGL